MSTVETLQQLPRRFAQVDGWQVAVAVVNDATTVRIWHGVHCAGTSSADVVASLKIVLAINAKAGDEVFVETDGQVARFDIETVDR